jgi:hypothetical protein
MLHRPVTPDPDIELRRKIAALREQETSHYIAGNRIEAHEAAIDAARLTKELRRCTTETLLSGG